MVDVSTFVRSTDMDFEETRHNAEEFVCGMKYLDSLGVPTVFNGATLSIVGRIDWLCNKPNIEQVKP